jgi:hypothetical protein
MTYPIEEFNSHPGVPVSCDPRLGAPQCSPRDPQGSTCPVCGQAGPFSLPGSALLDQLLILEELNATTEDFAHFVKRLRAEGVGA